MGGGAEEIKEGREKDDNSKLSIYTSFKMKVIVKVN